MNKLALCAAIGSALVAAALPAIAADRGVDLELMRSSYTE